MNMYAEPRLSAGEHQPKVHSLNKIRRHEFKAYKDTEDEHDT